MGIDRVYIACEACRKKKIKCDSQQPSCLHCTRKGITCVYVPRSKTRRRAKLSELRTLKKENSLLKKELTVSSISINTGFSDPETILPNVSGNDGTTSIALFDPVLHSDLDTISVPETVQQMYRMIKTVHPFLVDDVQFQNVFGLLSLLEFHTLLENYWKYENVNIMVVWKRIFVCDLLSEDGDAGEHASKSLILGLLAVGSTFAYNKNLIAKGYKCFELAKKYLKTDELWNPTVTTPQTICLLCMFEHARGNKTEELYYSKLAVNCALELGLNNDNITKSDPFSKDQETVRRFTWWSCYQVDMLVRTSLHQAPTVKKEITGVNPPQVSPFRYIMGLPEEQKDSYFEFFFISTITLELFVIAGETLEFCYGTWPSVSSEQRRSLIESCTNELEAFWCTASEKFGSMTPQILTFKLRFCYTNIVLSGYFIESMMLVPDEYELNSLRRCVHFAKQLLTHLETFEKMYGIWTIETFASDFIPSGMAVMLCALNFDCNNRAEEEKLLDYVNRFIKLMLSFPNTERYINNLSTIKNTLTEWSCDLSPTII
ncbi:CYFA0S12e01662g1_1 [Cyberlindnera fabianii]|uniref:CYFA0S12e01662g1_1 n=1 Tax=Cyberlindnera fabianii TaxID=36022 RepID=A0A061B193_CYBFA|nr:CYFA0S12e01662g1_1 [Cyberlindnera fabianii]